MSLLGKGDSIHSTIYIKFTGSQKKTMYKLFNGDFNTVIKNYTEIDVIITDPPYGLTSNKEDIAVDLTPLFDLAKGLIIFTQQPYTSQLVVKHRKYFKYEIIWDKVLTSGFLNANRQPLRKHENILVFGKPVYNPQKTVGQKNHSMGSMKKRTNNNYGHFVNIDNTEALGDLKHPTSIYACPKPHPSVALHRTEKPVSLMEWLVSTYSNIGDVVLRSLHGCRSHWSRLHETAPLVLWLRDEPGLLQHRTQQNRKGVL